MSVKLLTEHHLKFLNLKEAAEACPILHLSKCQIVGNLMPRLNLYKANQLQDMITLVHHYTQAPEKNVQVPEF